MLNGGREPSSPWCPCDPSKLLGAQNAFFACSPGLSNSLFFALNLFSDAVRGRCFFFNCDLSSKALALVLVTVEVDMIWSVERHTIS